MTHKIEFNRDSCIGCGACVSQCPDNWELVDTPDGQKAHPKHLAISDDELECNQAAADACPVQAITID
ncbi:ferredoxin [Candidatus Woesearchaeota archaeon]|nr:MAG: ferredoxin [Candidatus Woesearchaeota archaeon]